jgi:tetratricopeptide (TPR) repeat protein
VWHENTRSLQEEGKVQMLGIVEEQHADRARLFMQWKAMDWPVLIDALNLLDVPFVPITLLIDENGVIQRIAKPREDPAELVEAFLDEAGAAMPGKESSKAVERLSKALTVPAEDAPAESWREFGDAHFLNRAEGSLSRAMEGYVKAGTKDPSDHRSRFRLGVCLRKRYDSLDRKAGDFQKAVSFWELALKITPDNYIYRRRIQQYGPRLDKPYPFYDWIEKARQVILERGEDPFPLSVVPRGAEIAAPTRELDTMEARIEEPDPDAKIPLDEAFIDAEITVIPSAIPPGGAAHVHVKLQPRGEVR